MKKLFFLILLLIGRGTKAQQGQLELHVQVFDNDSLHSFFVLIGEDTLGHESFRDEISGKFDSLEMGIYQIHVYSNKDILEPIIRRTIYLYDEKINNCSIVYTANEYTTNYDKVTREEIEDVAFEAGLSLSYFNDKYINSNSALNDFYGIGLKFYYWKTSFKHVGFLGGGGINFSEYNIASDTSFSPFNSMKKVKERYFAHNLNAEAKVRFTLGNQKIWRHFGKANAILDLGVGYNFPVVFRSITNYAGNVKVVKRNLHEFSDFRAFINFGYAPILLFMEYRITDFVKDNYPELPIYNFGIRVAFRVH